MNQLKHLLRRAMVPLLISATTTVQLFAATTPRGAVVPYTRYEADLGTTGSGALAVGPSYSTLKIESEASDRKYLSLPSNGSYVQWTVSGSSQSGFNLRYSVPDGASGTLALYVNGTKVKDITLSSYWAWQYFSVSPSTTGVPSNTADGPTYEARMAFDELHFILPTPLNAGDVIKLQKDNNDGVTYGIDFIELESVPAAIAKPTGFLNIMDYGATPNDETNDAAAFRTCLDMCAGNASYLGVYIPAGKFINSQGTGSPSGNLYVANKNITIQGAGMWYTEIYFGTTMQNGAGFLFNADNIDVKDFYMNSATNGRIAGNKAINGTLGAGSTITNVWAQHFETGFWISSIQNNGVWNVTDGLNISNCRIRNVYADGVNLAKGTSNTIVDNCVFRSCTDDAMATWSVKFLEQVPPVACHGNIFRNNTVENNLRAGGLGFFGGHSHQAYNLLIKDGLGAGVRANSQFPAFPFGTSQAEAINIHDVTIIGCGTTKNLWTYRDGAIDLELPTPTQGDGYSVQYFNFNNIDVINSQHDAIFLHSYMPSENAFVMNNIYFTNVNIDGTGVAKIDNNGPQYFTGNATKESGGHGIYAANYSSSNNVDGWVDFQGSMKNIVGQNTAYWNTNNYFEIRISQIAPVTGVTVTPATLTLGTDATTTLLATVAPFNAANKGVKWTSSNTDVATVTPLGEVTGVAPGSATITAKTNDGNFTATSAVKVETIIIDQCLDQQKAVTCYKTATPITVDGNLNESVWCISNSVTKSSIGTKNNTTTYNVLWDANNLYVGVKVMDANLFSSQPEVWNADDIELFIDGANNGGTAYDANDRQFIVTYNKAGIWANNGNISGIVSAQKAIAGGYSVEVSIPWTNLSITPANNLTIGFDVANGDDDSGAGRQSQSVWNGNDMNWSNPSAFGDLVLSGSLKSEGIVTAIRPLISNASGVIFYPNPVNDKLTIDLGETKYQSISLFSIAGSQVLSQDIDTEATINIDFGTLKAGIYIVRLIGEQSAETLKVVKK